LKLYSFNEIKDFEKILIEKKDYKAILLMENAANSITDFLFHLLENRIDDRIFQIKPLWQQKNIYEKLKKTLEIFYSENKQISFLVGTANNGADALAVARKIAIRSDLNIKINILLFGKGKTELRLYQEKLLKNLGFNNIYFYELLDEDLEDNESNIKEIIKEIFDVPFLIDGLTGIGLKSPIDKKLTRRIDFIEKNRKLYSFTISIDLPTGLSNFSGKVLKTDLTSMLQWAKEEFFYVENRRYSDGYLILQCDMLGSDDISENNIELIEKKDLIKILKKPDFYSHKGNFGRVFIVSNFISTLGATIIASNSAIRSGAGYVYLLVKKELEGFCKSTIPYIITLGYDESHDFSSLRQILSKNKKPFNDTILLGSGFGIDYQKFFDFFNLFKDYKVNILIDGDGLNIISKNFDQFVRISSSKNAKIIFTPHPKEFERLFQSFENYLNEKDIKSENIPIIEKGKLFFKSGIIDGLLLKDYISYFIGGKGIYCNEGCFSGYSKAGTGDFIAGVFSALLSNYDIDDAAKILLCLQDEISLNLYKKDSALQSIIVSDLIDQLPLSIESLYS